MSLPVGGPSVISINWPAGDLVTFHRIKSNFAPRIVVDGTAGDTAKSEAIIATIIAVKHIFFNAEFSINISPFSFLFSAHNTCSNRNIRVAIYSSI
jgi:hypothetical protein